MDTMLTEVNATTAYLYDIIAVAWSKQNGSTKFWHVFKILDSSSDRKSVGFICIQ